MRKHRLTLAYISSCILYIMQLIENPNCEHEKLHAVRECLDAQEEESLRISHDALNAETHLHDKSG